MAYYYVLTALSLCRTLLRLQTTNSLRNRMGSRMYLSNVPVTDEPLFRFGLIADIQYCDTEDALNFQGTKIRRYRNSLDTYRAAISDWNRMKTFSNMKCAVLLGDLLDGKTALMKNQQECFDDFSSISQSSSFNQFFCFGNHCHYTFSRQEIYNKFLHNITSVLHQSSYGGLCTPAKLYYDLSPHPGWRFIFIDSYDISQIGASSEANKLLSDAWLRKNNPNDLTQSGTWFNDLPFNMRRWVPYNGGVSNSQLTWLENILHQSKQQNERIIIFSHQPIWATDKPQSLIWNSEDLLDLIHKYRNVCMWVAGHDHGGQYDIDSFGVHHLVPPAPIESEYGDRTYGHIDVHADGLQLCWQGSMPSDTVQPFPTYMKIV